MTATALVHGSRYAYCNMECRCAICRNSGAEYAANLATRHRDGPLISSRRWPLGELERFLGPMMTRGKFGPPQLSPIFGLRYTRDREIEVDSHDHITGELLGVNRRTIGRWRKDGIGEPAADKLAVEQLKVHPVAIWRDWFDVIDIEWAE